MMFAVITVALITGAVVERVKFSAILSFRYSLVYPGLLSGSSLGLGGRLAGQTRALWILPVVLWSTSQQVFQHLPWPSCWGRVKATRMECRCRRTTFH